MLTWMKVLIKTLKYIIYLLNCGNHISVWMCNYMHVHVYTICAHACMLMLHKHVCLQLASIKRFLTLKIIHYFRRTKQDLSKRQKMSNMTTAKKDLKQLTDIDHSFTFNSKVSNIVDDYLFKNETVMCGLKRKR